MTSPIHVGLAQTNQLKKWAGGTVSHSGNSTRDIEDYKLQLGYGGQLCHCLFITFLYIICLICRYIASHASFTV